MPNSVEYLTSTYSGAQLKAQAGTLERYVGHLDLSEEERASMRAVVPTGMATNTTRFKEMLAKELVKACLLYTSPSPRDRTRSRMPSSA